MTTPKPGSDGWTRKALKLDVGVARIRYRREGLGWTVAWSYSTVEYQVTVQGDLAHAVAIARITFTKLGHIPE